jgi:hypothetical protein
MRLANRIGGNLERLSPFGSASIVLMRAGYGKAPKEVTFQSGEQFGYPTHLCSGWSLTEPDESPFIQNLGHGQETGPSSAHQTEPAPKEEIFGESL